MNREGAEVTSAGRAFQTRATATEKARRPTVGSLQQEHTDRPKWKTEVFVGSGCRRLM